MSHSHINKNVKLYYPAIIVSRADNSVKHWRNLPISNPKPDIHNIKAHIKFGEMPLMFTQVITRKRKTDGHTTDGRTDTRTSNVKRATTI